MLLIAYSGLLKGNQIYNAEGIVQELVTEANQTLSRLR